MSNKTQKRKQKKAEKHRARKLSRRAAREELIQHAITNIQDGKDPLSGLGLRGRLGMLAFKIKKSFGKSGPGNPGNAPGGRVSGAEWAKIQSAAAKQQRENNKGDKARQDFYRKIGPRK